ncbi:hypothetical protein MSAN_01112000 [Mycena sanguinolenta]|uniref:Uncharacterized protein n=1 Tax=Mycena sanguinolenta TaxID=230812 RepID=A0A8H6YKP3_9AGAR|nr:hypothetical protein MSAN_01112000 [Mycena sanguinolenta]
MLLASRSSSPSPKVYTQVILGLIVPGVGLTTVLLTLYGYAAWNTVSRRYLDRVSFRLLTYALVANISFTISTLTAYPGRGCALPSFLTNLAGVFSPGMFFSIAVNLPLVLVFNVNGRKMEKYYVGVVTLIALVSSIAPYASGNLGWDDVNETCWLRSKDPSTLLRWFIGTESVWLLLASLGEVISFVIILGYLVMYRFVPGDTLSSCASTASHRPASTILRFRNIILRIGLYPVVSCILNISTTVIALYLFENRTLKHGEPRRNWKLNLAGLAMNAARPLIYGLLAATDPSFIRALHALRHRDNESETLSQVRTSGLEMSTIIYLPPEETWTNEQDKDNTSGSWLESQMKGDEMPATSTPVTNPEVGRVHPPVNDNGEPASIDLVHHI